MEEFEGISAETAVHLARVEEHYLLHIEGLNFHSLPEFARLGAQQQSTSSTPEAELIRRHARLEDRIVAYLSEIRTTLQL